MPSRWFAFAVCVALCTGNAACDRATGEKLERPPVAVVVAMPVQHEIGDSEYYTGSFEAVNSVEIRARVNGYLDSIDFESGSLVKRDALLFQIDPRPYQATLARATAEAEALDAQMKRYEADQARNERLLPSGTISREDYDKTVAMRLSATAQHQGALAQIEQAKLDLEFCRITAPFDGQVSRNFVSVGNLVAADTTLLTTIVSVDPIYVYFNIEERALQHFLRMKAEDKIPEDDRDRAIVYVGLELDAADAYPHKGVIDFGDNRVDEGTGTYSVRAVLDNKAGLFKPGYFARVRLPLGAPRKVLMVAERAIGRSLDEKYVYVVGDDNKVAYRKIVAGRLHKELRTVEEGLQAGDRIVVSGIQNIRPGMTVVPKAGPMPGDSAAPDPDAAPAAPAAAAPAAAPAGR
jgi:RND family efflux transporter MFP subunit